MLNALPLLVLVVVPYFALAVFAPTVFDGILFTLSLPSGAGFGYHLGDLLVTAGLFLLYFEILKSTRTSAASILDHALSLALLILCLIAFLIVPMAGTPTFFLITIMCLVDVVAGFTVTITAARHDMTFGG